MTVRNKTQRKALVTGATGFVGFHLTDRLLRAQSQVHVVVRPSSNLERLGNRIRRLTVHVHDGTTEGLSAILKRTRPDTVFHLASLYKPLHQPEDVEPLVTSNILFGIQLVEAMTAHNVHRLVNTGTSWQHYENGDFTPVNLYAASKQAFEMFLRYYIEATPLRVITLKLFDTYGPNDPRPKLLNLLKNIPPDAEPLQMSAGEQFLDMVHVDDVVEAFVTAQERLMSGSVDGMENYAVRTGEHIRLKDLFALFEKVTGKKIPVEWGKRPYRPREVFKPWSTGTSLPGWRPKVSLEDGLKTL